MGSNCCKGDASRPIRSSSSIYSRYLNLAIAIAQEFHGVPWVLRLTPCPSRAGASLDDRFTSSEDAGGVRLTVSAARAGDSGVYTLQATNAAGKDTARVRLEVSADEAPSGDDPPTFLRRLQDLTVKVGTRTRFLVEIVSSTECKVTWYRNERRLMEAERVSLVRDGTFWCADIAAVSVDDTGRWTCTAENAGGRASCSAHLNVLVPKAYKRPEFVEELRALLTEQGTVSLECKVVGVPTPVLRWFKDSREIKAGDVFALTANAEDPTSLGTYTCEAVNCMGRAYSSSKVHVVGHSREGSARPISSGVTPESPPIFTKELEDKFVRICEHLTLSCHIVVPPWPRSVVWYNKEGKVEPGERYHVVEDGVGGYLLEVPSAEWPDEGEWKCVATSSGGRVGISSCYVSMDVPKNYRKPRFMENLQAVLTEEGLVSFECKVVGFPTPVLSWFKDGQELKPGDVYQLTGTNSLGSYCCIARNCMGQASSSAELTVEDIQNQLNEEEKAHLFSKNQAPKFIQGLKSVEAKIDEPFRFTIKVAIPPEPSVQWYRDEQPVDECTRCHLGKEDRGGFYLDIQSLEFLDQAEWKCVALNDYGHSVTSCFLKLIIPRHYKKPRFLENLQAILSEEGAVNLECKVIGVPQPVLKWYKDGEELKPGDIHRIISGQDGTCCLGTYTCEAQNCMGIAASSASLLGFDDSMKAKTKKKAEEQALQRNLSLSTIHEERTSQMYDTPVGDITLDDKGEISFSFDGKEVSVSLYETPDLTEEEALQIVEMYADQLSENVTEHNVVELPPLRFVKETSTSGNLLMEAIIIDVSPEYFASPEEDLRTEADVEDISIADEMGPPQLSLDQDVGGEDYLEKTIALLSDEKADFPKKVARKKSDSQRSADDFYSLSLDQSLSEDKKDDDTQNISESFASAKSLGKPKSKSSKPSLEDGQESSDITKTILFKDEQQKQVEPAVETPVMKTKRERRSSRSSRRSSSGSEKSFSKSKEEPVMTQATLEQAPPMPSMTDEEFKVKMTSISVSLSKVINDVQVIERDIILKSELMSSAATASRSLEIISSLIKPLSEIHSIADAAKESALESREVSSTLFSNLPQPLKILQQSLTIIEKCIDVESDNKTLVKKTCVAFIETCGEDVKNLMNEITSITDKNYLMTEQKTLSEINSLISDMHNVIRFSDDTIKTRNLLSEASEIKTEETTIETKHLRDTQKAIFELKSPLNSLLCIVDTADSGKVEDETKVASSEVVLNDMSASIQDLQAALEQIESLSVKESTTSLHKYNTEIIETVMESVLKLRSSFEQLPTETKNEDDEQLFKQALISIKNNLSEISSHIETIEKSVGTFDILQSDNKLEVLQKMAQILISLENNLPRLETMAEIKTHMDVFHKNLTRVLENVIESNEAPKYFTLMEICDAVNRLNASIKNMDSDNVLSLASLSNTLRIIQDTFIKHVFESELNCSVLTNITDLILSIQEALNHAEEISLQLESERVYDIASPVYDSSKANVVVEHIDHTIAIINTIKSIETVKELKNIFTPALENICPVLEELKRNIASAKPPDVLEDEHISEISDVSFVKTLATPLLELNNNLLVLNQVIVDNIENLKENTEVMTAIAEPLHELHTTLQILQQDVISQYGEDVAPYDVSVNIVSAVQNLQSCIVMIQEQPGIEGIDEMSTLEDISGIKTTAETIPSDRLVLPTADEIAVEHSVAFLEQEMASSATAQALHTLNQHITILQNPEVVDALDTLSEVSDYSSLKSVALGLGELHNGIEEILHPFIMENSSDIANLINTSKLATIAEPMQELQQSLSVLDTSNIPIYEHILEIPTEKIHSVLQSISDFKLYLGKCIQVLLPAMETADKTIEISNKVEALREVCENLKGIIETTKTISNETPVKQEVITLKETVDNLLDATDVSKGIQIQLVKNITEELFEKVITVQEELLQFTPHTPEKLAEEAQLIQAIDEIENNIAVLEQYDFVNLSRASEITSCATPQLAVELESEPLVQMDDILQNAVNVLQDSAKETPLADLMILEDFFKTCKSEFTIIRLIISKPLSHKKIIRFIQEFTFLQNIVKDFKLKRSDLKLSDDVDRCLKIFFLEADENLKIIQKSLLNLVNSQSELLFTTPITKLHNASEGLVQIAASNEKLKDVVSKFINVIKVAEPMLQNIEDDVTKELEHPTAPHTKVENKLIIEMIDEILKYTEDQSTSSAVDQHTKKVLLKLTSCLQKHQDYKDATGSGKNLIVLKCLAECAQILQEKEPEKTERVKIKLEDSALKAVLTEMLEPLHALHSQLINIQEQVTSGVEEKSVSVDITTTESMIEAVSEIHREIVQQIESATSTVDNEDISLIMAADKEIHAIQDSLKSLENIPAVQELQEIAKPIEEVEKSLHSIMSSSEIVEMARAEKIPKDVNSNIDSLDNAIKRFLSIEADLLKATELFNNIDIKECIQLAMNIKTLSMHGFKDLKNPELDETKSKNIKMKLRTILSKFDCLNTEKYLEGKTGLETEKLKHIFLTIYQLLAELGQVEDNVLLTDEAKQKEVATNLLHNIDMYIELTEIVEKISAVIKIDELQKSVNIARELRDSIINISESEVMAEDKEIKIQEKHAALAQKLQNSISTLHVQVLDTTQELTSELSPEVLKQFVKTSTQLQDNLAAVTGVQTATVASIELISKDAQIDVVTETPTAAITAENAAIAETMKPVVLEQLVELKGETDKSELATEIVMGHKESNIEAKEILIVSDGEKTKVREAKTAVTDQEPAVVEQNKSIKPQEVTESELVSTVVDNSKLQVSDVDKKEEPKVDSTNIIKQCIEELTSANMTETLDNLATVINTEELKQTVSIAKTLQENIAAIEKTIQEDSSSTELVIEQAKQGELVKQLQKALLTVQEQIFDNYQQLEIVCDTNKLQQVADITVNLQTNLAAVVTVYDEAKDKEFTESELVAIPSTTVIKTGETVTLEQPELVKLDQIAKERVIPTAVECEEIAMGISTEVISQKDQVVTKEISVTEIAPVSSAESITPQIEEKAVVSEVILDAAGETIAVMPPIETAVEVIEKLIGQDQSAVSAETEPVVLESVTVGESVVMDGVQAIKTSETDLAKPKLETLLQNIETYISVDISQIVNDISDFVHLDELRQSLRIANELRENIAALQFNVEKEDIAILHEKQSEVFLQEAKLAQRLQNALTVLQTQLHDNETELLPVLGEDTFKKVKSIIAELGGNLSIILVTSQPVVIQQAPAPVPKDINNKINCKGDGNAEIFQQESDYTKSAQDETLLQIDSEIETKNLEEPKLINATVITTDADAVQQDVYNVNELISEQLLISKPQINEGAKDTILIDNLSNDLDKPVVLEQQTSEETKSQESITIIELTGTEQRNNALVIAEQVADKDHTEQISELTNQLETGDVKIVTEIISEKAIISEQPLALEDAVPKEIIKERQLNANELILGVENSQKQLVVSEAEIIGHSELKKTAEQENKGISNISELEKETADVKLIHQTIEGVQPIDVGKEEPLTVDQNMIMVINSATEQTHLSGIKDEQENIRLNIHSQKEITETTTLEDVKEIKILDVDQATLNAEVLEAIVVSEPIISEQPLSNTGTSIVQSKDVLIEATTDLKEITSQNEINESSIVDPNPNAQITADDVLENPDTGMKEALEVSEVALIEPFMISENTNLPTTEAVILLQEEDNTEKPLFTEVAIEKRSEQESPILTGIVNVTENNLKQTECEQVITDSITSSQAFTGTKKDLNLSEATVVDEQLSSFAVVQELTKADNVMVDYEQTKPSVMELQTSDEIKNKVEKQDVCIVQQETEPTVDKIDPAELSKIEESKQDVEIPFPECLLKDPAEGLLPESDVPEMQHDIVRPPLETGELLQRIEVLTSEEVVEAIEELALVTETTVLKETVEIAKELRENIATGSQVVSLEGTSPLVEKAQIQQAQLKEKLNEVLTTLQTKILDASQEITPVLPVEKLERISEAVVHLQEGLKAASISEIQILETEPVESTKVDSINQIILTETGKLLQHIEVLTSEEVIEAIEELALATETTVLKETVEIAKELHENIAAGSQVASLEGTTPLAEKAQIQQAQLKQKLNEALTTLQTKILDASQEITPVLPVEKLERISEAVVHLQEGLKAASISEIQTLETEPVKSTKVDSVNQIISTETGKLLQHIEVLTSAEVVEAIEELAVATETTVLKETVEIAKELRENIATGSQVISLEGTTSLVEKAQIQQAQLKEKLNEALTTLQTKILDASQEITPVLPVEKLERISEAVVHLQEGLKAASISEIHILETEPIESTKVESMKQLECLLQEITDKIDLSSSDRVPEDTEALRDSLDEVQTVIIKLKRDFDGANDTLNETLEDLECSVRSVQLQINEDSPPELLKEACATLQLLVNNMSETNETCVSEAVIKETNFGDVLDKCSKETSETVQLLEKASRVDAQGQSKLGGIVSNLNNLTETMKSLKLGFIGNADTVIENGIEILQSLDQIEEKVFSIEKELDSIDALPSTVRDTIVTAIHAVYSSLSNMRSTVLSTQKQYMFENYGKPSEKFLHSIKNLSSLTNVSEDESEKTKWKKLSKSLRNVLNHFEDIKFYINLDKTARLPSDAAFTKIILEELKSNIQVLSITGGLDAGLKNKINNSLKCVEDNLRAIEERSTLEVKEKIPIFKDLASKVLEITSNLKVYLENRPLKEKEPLVEQKIENEQEYRDKVANDQTSKTPEQSTATILKQTTEEMEIKIETAKHQIETIVEVSQAEEVHTAQKFEEMALPSTSKLVQGELSQDQKPDDISDKLAEIITKVKQKDVSETAPIMEEQVSVLADLEDSVIVEKVKDDEHITEFVQQLTTPIQKTEEESSVRKEYKMPEIELEEAGPSKRLDISKETQESTPLLGENVKSTDDSQNKSPESEVDKDKKAHKAPQEKYKEEVIKSIETTEQTKEDKLIKEEAITEELKTPVKVEQKTSQKIEKSSSFEQVEELTTEKVEKESQDLFQTLEKFVDQKFVQKEEESLTSLTEVKDSQQDTRDIVKAILDQSDIKEHTKDEESLLKTIEKASEKREEEAIEKCLADSTSNIEAQKVKIDEAQPGTSRDALKETQTQKKELVEKDDETTEKNKTQKDKTDEQRLQQDNAEASKLEESRLQKEKVDREQQEAVMKHQDKEKLQLEAQIKQKEMLQEEKEEAEEKTLEKARVEKKETEEETKRLEKDMQEGEKKSLEEKKHVLLQTDIQKEKKDSEQPQKTEKEQEETRMSQELEKDKFEVEKNRLQDENQKQEEARNQKEEADEPEKLKLKKDKQEAEAKRLEHEKRKLEKENAKKDKEEAEAKISEDVKKKATEENDKFEKERLEKEEHSKKEKEKQQEVLKKEEENELKLEKEKELEEKRVKEEQDIESEKLRLEEEKKKQEVLKKEEEERKKKELADKQKEQELKQKMEKELEIKQKEQELKQKKEKEQEEKRVKEEQQKEAERLRLEEEEKKKQEVLKKEEERKNKELAEKQKELDLKQKKEMELEEIRVKEEHQKEAERLRLEEEEQKKQEVLKKEEEERKKKELADKQLKQKMEEEKRAKDEQAKEAEILQQEEEKKQQDVLKENEEEQKKKELAEKQKEQELKQKKEKEQEEKRVKDEEQKEAERLRLKEEKKQQEVLKKEEEERKEKELADKQKEQELKQKMDKELEDKRVKDEQAKEAQILQLEEEKKLQEVLKKKDEERKNKELAEKQKEEDVKQKQAKELNEKRIKEEQQQEAERLRLEEEKKQQDLLQKEEEERKKKELVEKQKEEELKQKKEKELEDQRVKEKEQKEAERIRLEEEKKQQDLLKKEEKKRKKKELEEKQKEQELKQKKEKEQDEKQVKEEKQKEAERLRLEEEKKQQEVLQKEEEERKKKELADKQKEQEMKQKKEKEHEEKRLKEEEQKEAERLRLEEEKKLQDLLQKEEEERNKKELMEKKKEEELKQKKEKELEEQRVEEEEQKEAERMRLEEEKKQQELLKKEEKKRKKKELEDKQKEQELKQKTEKEQEEKRVKEEQQKEAERLRLEEEEKKKQEVLKKEEEQKNKELVKKQKEEELKQIKEKELEEKRVKEEQEKEIERLRLEEEKEQQENLKKKDEEQKKKELAEKQKEKELKLEKEKELEQKCMKEEQEKVAERLRLEEEKNQESQKKEQEKQKKKELAEKQKEQELQPKKEKEQKEKRVKEVEHKEAERLRLEEEKKQQQVLQKKEEEHKKNELAKKQKEQELQQKKEKELEEKRVKEEKEKEVERIEKEKASEASRLQKEKEEVEKKQKEESRRKEIEAEELKKKKDEELRLENEKDETKKSENEKKRLEEEKRKQDELAIQKVKEESEKLKKEKVEKKRLKKAKEDKEQKEKESKVAEKSVKAEKQELQIKKKQEVSDETKLAQLEKQNVDAEIIKIDSENGTLKRRKGKIDSEDLEKQKPITKADDHDIKPDELKKKIKNKDNLSEKFEEDLSYLRKAQKESIHRDQTISEITPIKLLDEKNIKIDLYQEDKYSRKLGNDIQSRESYATNDTSQHYIKEYHYEPTARPKHEDREKPRFLDHNHRDYTMEFARPSAYREKTLEFENISFEMNSGRGHIYKANNLKMDAQLRASAPPRAMPPESSRSSEPLERRSEIKHRSKALSEARSVLSEKRTSASRDIKRKPVFSTFLTDRTAVEGSRVKLTCSVLSSSDPKVTWYKNGVLLDNKMKYRTKMIDGLITLEVLNAVPSDSAEYSCTVENENGSINTSANLKVYPSFEASPIPPTFTRSIRDTYHLAENELVLECRIRGQPLPTITWLKDDRPISMNERFQAYYLADGVCRLAISSPTPEDSGKYTCKAENSAWSDQITHVVNFTGKESRLSPNLTTLERSRFNRQVLDSRRPHFGNVLTDYKVTTGGTIGLQVEIKGSPTRVEWLREGRSVMETYTNARTYVEQGLYTLALSDVTERESGLYTCRAWSSHGTVDMNAAITVVQPNELEGKPATIVGRPEKDVLISVGEDLNISFRVQGEPKPKVIFMKGIRDITNSQRVCKMTSDDYVKFTVKRSVISDAGTYCILARNAYGCDRAFVTVVVRQRASSENLISDWTYPTDDSALTITERKYKSVPDRIPGEPSVVDGGSNWVSIAWPKPDPTVAAPVLAYKVESWLVGKEGGARWTELGITPLNSFDAFNLKQGEEYHFRVTPRNRYGWGESVQTSSPLGVGLAGDRPEFLDILPGQLKVLIGETANLSCSVKGKPTPEVIWMKNGHEVEEDRRVTTSFNGFNCSLTINEINPDDEARYSCEATNVHGRASTYARLAVVTDRVIWEADAKLKRERSADAAGEYPPQFTMRLRDRRVQATYPVRLTCQVVGSPAPSVTWFKDGEDVILDSRHTKSQDEHFHTLEIAPTTLEDGGVYEVMARNSCGAISCHCNLVVDKGIRAYVAPEFCCGLEPLYRLREGEELRISAVVEAYPTVGVTWYRDGVRLRPSRRAIMTLDRDGQIELALAFVTPRDAGVYTCTASNEVGRATTSGKVEVIGDASVVKKKTPPMLISPDVPYSKEPMFIRKPRSSEAREGDTVIIQCEVVGDPKPDVYWLRDFLKPDYYRDATHFKRIGDGPEYRFEIPHAKLDYTGAYSVVARNVHGEAKAIISLQILARDPSSTEEHNIRYGRVDVIPRFERDLTDLLCYDGDAIEFECRVSGHPEPDIRWFHYTELIRENPDFEWSLDDGTARLKIKQVTAEDEGTYLCEASNNLGKATSSACLVVYPPGEPNTLSQRLRRPPALLSAASTPRSTPRSTPARSVSRTPGPDPRRLCSPSRQMPPKFYTYPFNKVVEEGDHVVFQCAVKGLPAPWATWDKDGVIITPSSRITIKEKDEILRILEIEEVTIEDVGVYRITLENDLGRVEASARLEVITQKGKFYAGVRSYSASPRKSLTFRRRPSRQD